jgi:hypothetical protein
MIVAAQQVTITKYYYLIKTGENGSERKMAYVYSYIHIHIKNL